MKSFFEENISIIKKNNPALYSRIADLSSNIKISIISSKTGENIPVIEINNKNIFIHSRFDPVKEASRFASEIDARNFDLFIVFGFGFAFHIEDLLKKAGADSTVLVLEKDPGIIKSAIAYRNIAGLLKDERLKVIADPDEEQISETLRGKSSRRVCFLVHRGSYQLDPEYYANIGRIARSYLSTKDVNIATLSRFEKTWASNIARNIREYISLPGANIFYDKFAGLPAIVAGAGPSLTGSIEFIRQNCKKALIVCVDTSYGILRMNGIVPHFCVTVDPQIINARYFEGDTAADTIFIADPTVHPSVFRLIKGSIAVTGMAFDMMKWIEATAGEKGELAYGGSVMTNAYDFAKRTGASPVVLTGQDLAFTGSLAHARGSYLDEEMFLRWTRFYNAHMKNRSQLTALPKIKVKGIRTPEVITNQKMMIFLAWFEKRNDPDLINAGFDGAFIKGVRHIPANEIIFPDSDADISGTIRRLYAANMPAATGADGIRKSLLNKCTKMRDELYLLSEKLGRAVSLSGELIDLVKKGNKSKLDYILKRLSETDEFLYSRDTIKDMIGFTIQRVIHTITEGYELDTGDSGSPKEELVAKRSLYLYEGMLEGSGFNIKILNKMITLLS
ncbi:MAG: 6-hydroxymethylpterin diphosphokinase MptE-like protein [Spirochaetota bacterium]